MSKSETVNDESAIRHRKSGTTCDTLSHPLEKSSLLQRNRSVSIAEENEDDDKNEHDEDDTGSKGSDNEKVISTKIEKVDNGLKGLRRKSLAPTHHEYVFNSHYYYYYYESDNFKINKMFFIGAPI